MGKETMAQQQEASRNELAMAMGNDGRRKEEGRGREGEKRKLGGELGKPWLWAGAQMW
jgi:hypothetical protein